MNDSAAILSAEVDELQRGSFQERVLYDRIINGRNAIPSVGQCWAIGWNDLRALVVISAVHDEFILGFPATAKSLVSDGQTIDTRLHDLVVDLTVWWGVETGLGIHMLDSYLGDALDVHESEQAHLDFVRGVADLAASTDAGVARSILIADAFARFSDEEWSEHSELGDSLNLSSILDAATFEPSRLARILSVSLPDAIAIIRGDRTLTPDEISILAGDGLRTHPPNSGPRLVERLRPLVRALNTPSRKSRIKALAATRHEDEAAARIHIVRDLKPVAARQVGAGSDPDWESRVDLYLDQHLQS
ncbi:hypothetical protein OHA72_07300 [Dactylosporangium sp. NBC_01737]|uniref:hypothetical protein n=1 Tax=Dactylosporangium sp. NBC_01737 TaxID=2975959 RepID=UPI002E0E517E|nr:hypothetical protein OHA72_07300 [Dactylosporangium sp. NBC_01737]